MCRYAQFTLSSRQLNYRGFPLIFLNQAVKHFPVFSLSQSCGQKFLHSIIVLHKIAILQFIRKSTSIFPPTAYYFFYNRSSCFLLFDQSKFYMFKVGTDLYFIFLPYVCRCTFYIFRLFYMCIRVKYVLSYFFI